MHEPGAGIEGSNVDHEAAGQHGAECIPERKRRSGGRREARDAQGVGRPGQDEDAQGQAEKRELKVLKGKNKVAGRMQEQQEAQSQGAEGD